MAGVSGLMTTRRGGCSVVPWDSMNLGSFVQDDPASVAHNRAFFQQQIGATPVFLRQVHGTRVIRLCADSALPQAPLQQADASVTTEAGIACCVLVADCLPVLFAAANGRAVGAAHAGWRGLAAGVLEETLRQVCDCAECDPREIHVWLGACIGPGRFEVGDDVLQAFGCDFKAADPSRFTLTHGGKWLANLPQLARDRLAAGGVRYISGADACTVEQASKFFSYRRDGITGRMAAAVWIER